MDQISKREVIDTTQAFATTIQDLWEQHSVKQVSQGLEKLLHEIHKEVDILNITSANSWPEWSKPILGAKHLKTVACS